MYRIDLSIQITRRKFIHQVTDENGKVLYVDRSIANLFRWLYDNDILEAELVEGGRRWQISLSPLPA